MQETTYVVAQSLSMDMEASKFDGDFLVEYFPSPSGFIVWQDPTLPQLAYTLVPVKESLEPGVILVVDSKRNWGTPKTESHCYSFPLSKWKGLLSGDCVVGHLQGMLPDLDHELTDDEESGMIYLARLLAKVLTFAALDHTRIGKTKLVTRNERKEVGIHPKRDPGYATTLIRYLPHVHVERAAQHLEYVRENEKSEHRFLGRIGYVRTYQHERYVNMRGKTQYIWPIPAPTGYKVEYRIRKP